MTSVPEERALPRSTRSTLDVITVICRHLCIFDFRFRIARERFSSTGTFCPTVLSISKPRPTQRSGFTQPPPSPSDRAQRDGATRHTDGHRENVVLRSIPFSLHSFVCSRSRSFSRVTVLVLVASRQTQLHQYSHMDTRRLHFSKLKGVKEGV